MKLSHAESCCIIFTAVYEFLKPPSSHEKSGAQGRWNRDAIQQDNAAGERDTFLRKDHVTFCNTVYIMPAAMQNDVVVFPIFPLLYIL